MPPGNGADRRRVGTTSVKEKLFLKTLPVLAIVIIQSFLCAAHWFMYRTWIDFWWPMSPTAVLALRIAFALLSFTFVIASLLGFRFSNPR